MLGSLQSLGENVVPGLLVSSSRRRHQAPGRPRVRDPALAAAGADRKGFAVTGVGGVKEALAAAEGTSFAYAAVEIRLGDGDGVALVAQLHEFDPAMRIVVVTGFDSFASVIVALRAGAVDYLPKPIQAGEPANALLGRLLWPLGAPHAARRRSCPWGAYPADLRAMRQEQDQDGAAASDASSDPAADLLAKHAPRQRDVTTNRGPGKPQRATGATPNAISGLATNPS